MSIIDRTGLPLAIITFSPEGTVLARRLAAILPNCQVYFHETIRLQVLHGENICVFSEVKKVVQDLWSFVRGLVFIAPVGIAVRAVAPRLTSKLTDPAVVTCDILGRHVVSLLSGHEGGANDLALAVADVLGAEAVISTTREARRRIIVGVGCRRGVSSRAIVSLCLDVLTSVGVTLDDVRLLASATIKSNEPGLIAAARELGRPIRFLPLALLRQARGVLTVSRRTQSLFGVSGIAEPAALLGGTQTTLLQERFVRDGVAIALARECAWRELTIGEER